MAGLGEFRLSTRSMASVGVERLTSCSAIDVALFERPKGLDCVPICLSRRLAMVMCYEGWRLRVQATSYVVEKRWFRYGGKWESFRSTNKLRQTAPSNCSSGSTNSGYGTCRRRGRFQQPHVTRNFTLKEHNCHLS